ncbi:pyridoxamine 5'-phosphate oxidase family protein [Shewanella inventionis]|uniref:FAD-binding FR-type domain-containing protein n=1 Tax=Shewanella inventionis TaxID=1738770 RepID=A0ABQ1JHS3_9GAMM|nr:pyridoxamine 5'-phosphate oxidase family protein [Shewanella inventionis]MCL1159200.1 FAD-binding oxidoreductase [Shewanella inventionis]GGB67424.1 hypothetical protein GCM10011607_30070 [Shewanella inventionis]
MPRLNTDTPFHAGELEAQARVGVHDLAQRVKGFIRKYLPDQHRTFHTQLPFLIVAGADEAGKIWVTLIEGEEGFVQSPDPHHLKLNPVIDANDPLAQSFQVGSHIGVLGIELATRRRNRFSGYVRPDGNGFSIDISQTFGNCPQYIHPRHWSRDVRDDSPTVIQSAALTEAQVVQIEMADTMFIGSGQMREEDTPSSGYDASHRGGEPGFVRVLDKNTLQIPDYAGNNFFNTIGNLILNPKIGLLFIDFNSGSLLHITGKASVEWAPPHPEKTGVLRLINVEIDTVIERPQAIALRWTAQQDSTMNLKLVKRTVESSTITSFYFVSTDGRRLKPFKAGQHLPIEIRIPGDSNIVNRSYSLSSSPFDLSHYRISVKREEHGKASRYLHDELKVGMQIITQPPSGDFNIPDKESPLVLISAGVGLTPMVPMLHQISNEKRQGWFIHGTQNSTSHAIREEIYQLIEHNDKLQQIIYYSEPDKNDVIGQDYDIKGRITAEDLIGICAEPSAHYLLCGPLTFIAELQRGLEAAGVSTDRIHFETFGSAN